MIKLNWFVNFTRLKYKWIHWFWFARRTVTVDHLYSTGLGFRFAYWNCQGLICGDLRSNIFGKGRRWPSYSEWLENDALIPKRCFDSKMVCWFAVGFLVRRMLSWIENGVLVLKWPKTLILTFFHNHSNQKPHLRVLDIIGFYTIKEWHLKWTMCLVCNQ